MKHEAFHVFRSSSSTEGTGGGSDAPAFRYNAALAYELETKWQAEWERAGTFRTPNPGEAGFDASKPKQFILDMFPYPSGVGLHVGHPLGYIATDIYARYLRMTGHNVLYTMGFDAFGLPAEQYAVQTNTHPRVTTERNIATMRAQLKRLGLSHDERRSVSTTDPAFYKWTQWIFLQIYGSWFDEKAEGGQGRARPIGELVELLEKGERTPRTSNKAWAKMDEAERRAELDAHRLAYLAEVPVNWCPMLGTVLANEEVIDGKSERGNYPVYKRPLKQWMMRITEYAERLLADLDRVDWPEAIKLMQRHWIGRSEGAYVDFDCAKRRIRVFTTRPDTLFGATYMVLSPEHEMLEHLLPEKYGEVKFARAIFPGAEELIARSASPREMVDAYQAYAKDKSDESRSEGKEKTGAFIGAYAVNPANGARLPVFIADYVLAGYGTGAIMAVPAHDERDWDFATAFKLPIVPVYCLPDGSTPDGCFSGDGVAINSPPNPATGQFTINGLSTADAKRRIAEQLEKVRAGKATVNYKLRDWLFSRQRYWGEPFPIVFDEEGTAHALPESMLPVELPEVENFQPESSSDPDAPPRPPLARATEWTSVTLDLGDGPRQYTRETNTMPNWAGSCWYYLRYLDPTNDKQFVSPEVERYWMTSLKKDGSPHTGGVDLYVGGVEHAVLHLLYARFWHKVLFDLGHVSTPEPFGRLFNQGYIQAAAYTDARGAYVPAEEVEERDVESVIEVDRLQTSDGGVEPLRRATNFFWKGEPVFREFGKMGKSLKNAVGPEDVFAEFGCDTMRVYEMSMGPLEASKPWNTRDIAGAYRFLQRVWRNIVDEQTGAVRVSDAPTDAATLRLMHKTIAGVRHDMKTLGFNTAIAKLIEFNNELTKTLAANPAGLSREVAETLTLMLAPLAPHMGEELWAKLAHAGGVLHAPFPVADAALAADDQVEIPVQVQGKIRAKIMVATGADAATIEAAAMADAKVKAHLEGKTIKKVIVVPGKMVNVVVG